MSLKREYMLKQVQQSSEKWDVVIIGGGATGLGIAVDSISRGYRTLLVERYDFTQGTSSRSTKLIHGGVRYLRQGNISLVFEALRERGRLQNNAPHLVRKLPFILPAPTLWKRWFYRIGLWLYDLLAGRLSFGSCQSLSLSQLNHRVKTLKTDKVSGGVLYFDGQTDDARLGLSLAKTAVALGAVVLNHAEVTELHKGAQGIVTGLTWVDRLARDGERSIYKIEAGVIFNATGVFIDQLRQVEDASNSPIVAPSQGAHLVIPKRFLPGDTAIIFPETPDGRVLFAIPWYDRAIVGTTDVPREQIEAEPRPLEEELNFILSLTQEHLDPPPQASDVLSVFAGLRPLVSQKSKEGVSSAQISREHTVLMGLGGMIHITGGKWTTYRKMAEDALDFAIRHHKLPPQKCVTSELKLTGWKEAEGPLDILSVYGSERVHLEALCLADPLQVERLHPSLPYRIAEITFAIKEEMAMTVEDVLSRRTRALLLSASAAIEVAPRVASLIAEINGYSEEWVQEEIQRFEKLAARYQWLPSDHT